jgi:hypothetical protein
MGLLYLASKIKKLFSCFMASEVVSCFQGEEPLIPTKERVGCKANVKI